MDIFSFSQRNRKRCESPRGFNLPLNSWSLCDWMTALTGEVGEAANIIKKIKKAETGVPGNKSNDVALLRGQLAEELADAACYLDLLTQAAGFDLEHIREEKLKVVSRRIGYQEDPRG